LLAAVDGPGEIIGVATAQVTVLQPQRQVRQRGGRGRGRPRLRGSDPSRRLEGADGALQRRVVTVLPVDLTIRQA
jgi:hypothetical protein